MLCQLKSLLLLGVLLFANGAFGQPMIWDDTSPETIVFELTNKEALKLLKGKLRQKQWDKIQQTPFARFTDTWSNPPVKGHFLLADVERNEVHYRYAPVIPFHVSFSRSMVYSPCRWLMPGELSGKMPKCG